MKAVLSPRLLAACTALIGLPLAAQEYHSNDLTPAGTLTGKLAGSNSSGKQAGSACPTSVYSPHAYLFSNNALTAIDLNPTGAYYSMANCLDDSQQGGWAYMPTGVHAVVWSGSATSCIDLNPSGYNFSYCNGVDGGEQVGYAQQQSYFITASHAFCWHGSAASAIDLHSGTYPYSRAWGCKSGEEVGYVSNVAYAEGEQLSYRTGSRAIVWHGSAASAVDLHPVGFDSSEATCTNGTQQGGWGYIALGTTHQHALVWLGTADSVVDLHPAGYTDTRLNAITATQQVGEGWVGAPGAIGSVRHALVWSGTADSVIDLNQYLPTGYTHGVATGIDANGNVVGYAHKTMASGVYMPTDAVAVVFAPGAPPPAQLTAITLDATNVLPSAAVTGTVTLSSAAPAGGVNLTFLSGNLAAAPTPASLTIAEGDSGATFPLTVTGTMLTTPTTFKVYSSDGTVSRFTSLTVTPVVNLATVTANSTEGGLATTGTISLSIPAQSGGATVSLSSGDTSLVTVPASVALSYGVISTSFTMTTKAVTTLTTVPITATFNGKTVTTTVTLSAQPIMSLATLTIPSVVGGQSVYGTVSLNNWSRSATGTVVTLQSGDTGTLQVPASVTIPYGYQSANFLVTTSVVNGAKGVSVKATSNSTNLTTTVTVNPIPPITITLAEWDPDTLLFKVQVTTNDNTAIFTFGTDATSGPIGTMQLELGVWKGATIMNTAPTTATVWSSFGAVASLPVTIKGVSSGGGGTKTGGGGGGGGGSTTTTKSYKLAVSKTGKGTITMSPSGTTFTAGTVVTLTATPDVGSPWIGWTGSVISKSQSISVTVNSDMSLTANFK